MINSSKYLIIGGGLTADAAVRGIRESDKNGTITVLSAERHPPYNRPPLSKKLWMGKPFESVWLNTEQVGIDLILDTRATNGDVAKKTIVDNRGNTYSYEKLLLATGGTPRHLPLPDDGVIYFRTVDDYLSVRELANRKAGFIVIGGGFIGSEIAAALLMNDCKVTMIFPDNAIGARIYPPALSEFLNSYFQQKGAQLLTKESVKGVEKSGTKIVVKTGGGKTISGDAVIAGIGIHPETDLAQTLGLEIDNGIVVDEFLRTSRSDIYAAGDVANFYSPALEVRRRVEHEDNARTMGTVAGRNMAGKTEPYLYLPYFYSDLFDLGYEAVGEFGVTMDIVEDWKEPFRKGVVYYLRYGRVRGVLLWNTWGQVDAARHLISTKEKFSHDAIIGTISD